MILDNENENLKVHEWITKYTQSGKLSIVTGYFTVGALAFESLQARHNHRGASVMLAPLFLATD